MWRKDASPPEIMDLLQGQWLKKLFKEHLEKVIMVLNKVLESFKINPDVNSIEHPCRNLKTSAGTRQPSNRNDLEQFAVEQSKSHSWLWMKSVFFPRLWYQILSHYRMSIILSSPFFTTILWFFFFFCVCPVLFSTLLSNAKQKR